MRLYIGDYAKLLFFSDPTTNCWLFSLDTAITTQLVLHTKWCCIINNIYCLRKLSLQWAQRSLLSVFFRRIPEPMSQFTLQYWLHLGGDGWASSFGISELVPEFLSMAFSSANVVILERELDKLLSIQLWMKVPWQRSTSHSSHTYSSGSTDSRIHPQSSRSCLLALAHYMFVVDMMNVIMRMLSVQ